MLTDADSLINIIKTENFYEDFYKDFKPFGLSNYPKESKYYDNLIVGKMKDERCGVHIKGFEGLKSTMYNYVYM